MGLGREYRAKDWMRGVYQKKMTEVILMAVKTHRDTPIDFRIDKYVSLDVCDEGTLMYDVYVTYLVELEKHIFRVIIPKDFNVTCEMLK